MIDDADSALLERLRTGDQAALLALMQRYAPHVHRLAHRISRNEADAEEVVQDVFLVLFRKVDSFEGRAALGTWLYRITTNAALRRRRGKRAQLEVFLEDYHPIFLADGNQKGERPLVLRDWSRTPEDELLWRESGTLLRRVMDELPAAYRAVLALRDLEGLSNEEAAEALGESVSSVKSRLHRARMALRERLTRALAMQPAAVPAAACS